MDPSYQQALIAQLMNPQMNDQASPQDQMAAYRNMMQQRGAGSMQMMTPSPFGPQDKLAMQLQTCSPIARPRPCGVRASDARDSAAGK